MDQSFQLNILLHLKDSSSTPEMKTVAFPSPPATILDIKKEIEASCNIPSFMQTLFHQHCEASDDCSLQCLYLRSGDAVEVIHEGQGEVSDVKFVVDWLEKSLEMCLKLLNENKIIYHVEEELYEVFANETAKSYIQSIFSPWPNPCKLVNALHFDFLGGVELLLRFHKALIRIKRHQHACPRIFQYLNFQCVKMIANYAMNNDLSRRLAECGLLETCVETFVMVPANDKRMRSARSYDKYTVQTSLRGIFNIAEIPDVQFELSLRHDMIEQALLAASSSLYSTYLVVMTTNLLVCLSRCRLAHKSLMEPRLIEKVMGLYQQRREAVKSDKDTSELMAMESFTSVFLAQMILGSPRMLQVFPAPLVEKMTSLMEFGCRANSGKIQAYEVEHHLYWGTFIPCIEYLYDPQEHSSDGKIPVLQSCSVRVLLCYLRNCLGRKVHVGLVLSEKLADFITCLPWILPEEFREMARAVLRELAIHHQVQPPSLVSLSQAVLAKSCWGLRKLTTMSSISELCL